MNETHQSKYLKLMKFIKLRTEVVWRLVDGRASVVYEATTIETAILQIRIILEHIALASLIANKEKYAQVRATFEKDWHANRIFKDLERINPYFYPEPIIEKETGKQDVTREHIAKTDGFLTREKFAEVYSKCSALLHASNPFAAETDYDYYKRELPNWLNEIICLLNSHQIRPVDYQNLYYLVHMKEDADDDVHIYTFEVANSSTNS